jgi:hypothetical protein
MIMKLVSVCDVFRSEVLSSRQQHSALEVWSMKSIQLLHDKGFISIWLDYFFWCSMFYELLAQKAAIIVIVLVKCVGNITHKSQLAPGCNHDLV